MRPEGLLGPIQALLNPFGLVHHGMHQLFLPTREPVVGAVYTITDCDGVGFLGPDLHSLDVVLVTTGSNFGVQEALQVSLVALAKDIFGGETKRLQVSLLAKPIGGHGAHNLLGRRGHRCKVHVASEEVNQ